MDIGAVSVRGNHDHEVLRQGIAFSKKTGKFESGAERKAALQNVVSGGMKERKKERGCGCCIVTYSGCFNGWCMWAASYLV